jgi:hypothetical protein
LAKISRYGEDAHFMVALHSIFRALKQERNGQAVSRLLDSGVWSL